MRNRKGEIETDPLEIPAKLDEPMAKRKTTFFHSGVEQVARFLEDDDNNDGWWKWWWFRIREHLFTKVNANQNTGKPTAQLLLRTITEESMLTNRRLGIAHATR
jgi:hypothetical protein